LLKLCLTHFVYLIGKLNMFKLNLKNRGKKLNELLMYQAQARDQFLATTKLAPNKAICLKTKKINKSKMFF